MKSLEKIVSKAKESLRNLGFAGLVGLVGVIFNGTSQKAKADFPYQKIVDSNDVVINPYYNLKLSGDKIVWSLDDVYMFDISKNKIIPICTAPNIQFDADVSNDRVVWVDRRSGGDKIYVWDSLFGEKQITNQGNNYFPILTGDKVAWIRINAADPNNSSMILWDPVNGEKQITNARPNSLSTSENKLVWKDFSGNNNPAIFMIDLNDPNY